MSTPHDPSELASALVDGLLSEDDAARAAVDPGVATLAGEIQQMRSALREVPPPPDLAKARSLEAALDAGMDAYHGSTARRSGKGHGWQPWLAAAGIVAVLMLGLGLLSLRDDSDEDVTASAEDSVQEDVEAEEDDEAPSPPAPNEAEGADRSREGLADAPSQDGDGDATNPTADDLSVIELGALADEEELAGAVAGHGADAGTVSEPAQGEQPDSATAEPESGLDSCPQLSVTGDPLHGASTFVATATLAGEPVWVHLYPEVGDRARLVATTYDCVDIVDRSVTVDP